MQEYLKQILSLNQLRYINSYKQFMTPEKRDAIIKLIAVIAGVGFGLWILSWGFRFLWEVIKVAQVKLVTANQDL